MKISNRLYDIIKYVICIALPAIQGAMLALTSIFGWSWGNTVSEVIIVIQTLLAALFCISIAGYTPPKKIEIEIDDED